MAKKKVDPLNKKQYGAVSAMLTVSDIPAAVSFYQKALGFTKRGIMNGPDGKPIHAELTLRGTTLMLGPENPTMGKRTAKTLGASPAGLFLYVENVDKVVSKALGLGATGQGPVMDMFWGDRCGSIVDPDGYAWMVGTHKAEPAAKEMKKKMLEQIRSNLLVPRALLEPANAASTGDYMGQPAITTMAGCPVTASCKKRLADGVRSAFGTTFGMFLLLRRDVYRPTPISVFSHQRCPFSSVSPEAF